MTRLRLTDFQLIIEYHLMYVVIEIATCPSTLGRYRWRYTCCLVRGFSSDSRTTMLFFCSHFPHYWVSKIVVLIFVNYTLSWLLEWCHWPANQQDAVWRRHILAPGQIVLNPVRAGTILIPGIGYNDLMENPETLGEPWWAFTHTERKNRKILHLFWTGSCTGDVEAVQLTSIIILIS